MSIKNGWEYWKQGDFDKASQVAEVHKDKDAGLHLQGNLHYICGKYKKAIDSYGKISSSYEKYEDIRVNMMNIYAVHLKDISKAKEIAKNVSDEKTILDA